MFIKVIVVGLIFTALISSCSVVLYKNFNRPIVVQEYHKDNSCVRVLDGRTGIPHSKYSCVMMPKKYDVQYSYYL